MAVDITSLSIEVKSTGIAQAATDLEALSKAASNVEGKTNTLKSAFGGLSSSQAKQADNIEKLLQKMQKQADLLGANVAATNAYTAAEKGATELQQLKASLLGGAVDAYKNMGQAQAEATKMNKELDASYASLTKQADAYYASTAKAQASGNILNQNGQRAEDYKKLQAAEAELARQTKALADEEARLASISQKRDYQKYIADTKAASDAAKELASTKQKTNTIEIAAAREAEAFVRTLRIQAEQVGMTSKQIKEYNAELLRTKAAELGVTAQTEAHITALKNAKGPHEGFNLLTAGSTRELLVLGHELSQGSFQRFGGSLIVLAERINFLPSLMEKAAAGAAALNIGLGVFLGVIASVVAVVGVAIFTFTKSSTALHDMKNAVILTGGAAGATGSQFYDMANKIGETTGKFADARKAVLELANTGRFTAGEINQIAEAAVNMEKYAGVSIDHTIKMFEKLAAEPINGSIRGFKGVSTAALELNKTLNYLEPEVLAEIMHLEQIGKGAEASKIAIKDLGDVETKRAKELKGNLTLLGEIADTVGEKFSRMWNGLWHKESDMEQLTALKAKLADVLRRDANGGEVQGMQEKKLLTEIESLTNKMFKEKSKAIDDQHHRELSNAADLALVGRRTLLDRNRNEDSLANALAKNEEGIAAMKAAGIKTEFFSEKANLEAIEAIKKQYATKAKVEKGVGLSGLNEANKEIDAILQLKERQSDNEIRIIEKRRKAGIENETDAATEKYKILDEEEKVVIASYNAQIKNAENFHSKDNRLNNDAAIIAINLAEKRDKFISDLAVKREDAATKEVKAAMAAEKVAQQVQDSKVKSLDKEIDAIEDMNYAYEHLTDAQKKAGVSEKQLADLRTESAIQRMEQSKLEGKLSSVEIARLDELISKERQRQAGQIKLEGHQAENKKALDEPARLKAIAAETSNLWKETGNDIEKALTSAFGNAGNAAGLMFKAFADGQARQIELAQQLSVAKKEESDGVLGATQLISQIQDKQAEDRIHAYGDMTGAAKKFFKEGSTGYKVMETAEKAFRVVELAGQIKAFVLKSGMLEAFTALFVTSKATEKGVEAGATAASVAQSGVQASSWGIVAVVKALASLPFPFNIAAGAVTLAAVIAVGAKMFGGVSGGSVSVSEQRQASQGTGSVLGDPTAKSESIAHSLSIMEKNSGLGLAQGSSMVSYLKIVSESIQGLAGLVVGRTSSITSGPALANPTGFWSKLGNSIFGGKKTLEDTGISANATSLTNVMQSGVNASQYADIKTGGGWFSSDKHNTNLQSLGKEANDQFTKVIVNMANSIKESAKSLGLSGDAFTSKLNSFVIDIGKISLKDMSGDDVQKALEAVFSKLGDDMARFAIVGLDKFQKVGEGYLETVVRVTNDLMQVKDVFAVLDKSFALTGIAAVNVSESLISAAGGLEALTSGTKFFVDNFLTEAEKMGPITDSVAKRLKELNLTDVTTIDLYKKKIRSLDLTNAADQQLYAAMLALAPAFKDVADYSDKLAEGTVDLTKAQKAAVDLVNKARTNLENAYKAESSALQSTIDKTKQYVQTLKDFQNGLKLGANSPLTNQQKYAEARSQFDAVALAAKGGDAAAQQKFTSIANDFLNASKVINASGQAYTDDFNKVQDMTSSLVDAAVNQVDVATASLNALNEQVAGLMEIDKSVMSVTQAITELRAAIEAGKAAGVSNAALGLPDAVATTPAANTNVLVDAINRLETRLTQIDVSIGVQTGVVATALVETSEQNAETISNAVAPKGGSSGRGDSNTNRLIQIA